MIPEMTAFRRAVMNADESFQKSGDGGTKTWLLEHLEPQLEKEGLTVISTAERDSLRLALDASESQSSQREKDAARWEATYDAAMAEAYSSAQSLRADLDEALLRADTAEAALAESRAREVVLCEAATALVEAKLVLHVNDGNCGDHQYYSEKYIDCVDCDRMERSTRGQIEDRFRAVLANTKPAAREWMERVRAEGREEAYEAMRVGSAPRVSNAGSVDVASLIAAAREEGRALWIEEAASRVHEAIKTPSGWVGITDGQEKHTAEWLRALLSTSPAASAPHPLLSEEEQRESAALLAELTAPPVCACSQCGRKEWAPTKIGKVCGMTQPDGSRCGGSFRGYRVVSSERGSR